MCSNTDQEQCTFKQFEMMCSSDEVMTSQFAETMYTVDTCTSDIQKEDLFAEVVTLYYKIRVHHACRTYMDKSRNQMNVSRTVESLRKTLKIKTTNLASEF